MSYKKIKKFRKKPVVVEAYQTDKKEVIHTLEGDMIASPGDWIITGINGEKYPCKPDIFEETYEKVEWDYFFLLFSELISFHWPFSEDIIFSTFLIKIFSMVSSPVL